jgi:hypothetical protein
MTASDFVAEVRLATGETSETLSDNQILRYINREYLRIATMYDFPQLETSTTITTSSGTAEYDFSVSDINKVENVQDATNGLRLRAISGYQYDTYTQSTSTITGTPVFYHLSGVASDGSWQITFFPTPDGTYTINVDYKKNPAELVTSPAATSSILHEAIDEPISLGARASAWQDLGDIERAKYFRGLQMGSLEAVRREALTFSRVPIHIGVR